MDKQGLNQNKEFSTLIALISDLHTGINKVDFFTLLGWKIFNNDYDEDKHRDLVKYVFFSYAGGQYQSPSDLNGIMLSDVQEEFEKQFPNLINMLKNRGENHGT
jgi:hypothetical protein